MINLTSTFEQSKALFQNYSLVIYFYYPRSLGDALIHLDEYVFLGERFKCHFLLWLRELNVLR